MIIIVILILYCKSSVQSSNSSDNGPDDSYTLGSIFNYTTSDLGLKTSMVENKIEDIAVQDPNQYKSGILQEPSRQSTDADFAGNSISGEVLEVVHQTDLGGSPYAIFPEPSTLNVAEGEGTRLYAKLDQSSQYFTKPKSNKDGLVGPLGPGGYSLLNQTSRTAADDEYARPTPLGPDSEYAHPNPVGADSDYARPTAGIPNEVLYASPTQDDLRNSLEQVAVGQQTRNIVRMQPEYSVPTSDPHPTRSIYENLPEDTNYAVAQDVAPLTSVYQNDFVPLKVPKPSSRASVISSTEL